eukprot:4958342-Pleurochrysis_carterae.AAC.3
MAGHALTVHGGPNGASALRGQTVTVLRQRLAHRATATADCSRCGRSFDWRTFSSDSSSRTCHLF